ncbi:hypothetical protein ACE6ED_09640 [Paenibacillus sp. CN-4]|uniref:hypothetical protein n=1 Tax=Paenibacillus nanchangensis TaxID=3348343 RepID=UPI00397808B6
MAYTRGNLAVQQQQNEKTNPRYREKTKVVTRRLALPMQEKLLYLVTLAVFIAVSAVLIGRYAHIYDLNAQAQALDKNTAKYKKEISTLQMQKQTLEQKVVEIAQSWGWQVPDEGKTIHVPRTETKSAGN